eukprot:ANDGO_08352.mRNA.1 hypothetical protein
MSDLSAERDDPLIPPWLFQEPHTSVGCQTSDLERSSSSFSSTGPGIAREEVRTPPPSKPRHAAGSFARARPRPSSATMAAASPNSGAGGTAAVSGTAGLLRETSRMICAAHLEEFEKQRSAMMATLRSLHHHTRSLCVAKDALLASRLLPGEVTSDLVLLTSKVWREECVLAHQICEFSRFVSLPPDSKAAEYMVRMNRAMQNEAATVEEFRQLKRALVSIFTERCILRKTALYERSRADRLAMLLEEEKNTSSMLRSSAERYVLSRPQLTEADMLSRFSSRLGENVSALISRVQHAGNSLSTLEKELAETVSAFSESGKNTNTNISNKNGSSGAVPNSPSASATASSVVAGPAQDRTTRGLLAGMRAVQVQFSHIRERWGNVLNAIQALMREFLEVQDSERKTQEQLAVSAASLQERQNICIRATKAARSVQDVFSPLVAMISKRLDSAVENPADERLRKQLHEMNCAIHTLMDVLQLGASGNTVKYREQVMQKEADHEWTAIMPSHSEDVRRNGQPCVDGDHPPPLPPPPYNHHHHPFPVGTNGHATENVNASVDGEPAAVPPVAFEPGNEEQRAAKPDLVLSRRIRKQVVGEIITSFQGIASAPGTFTRDSSMLSTPRSTVQEIIHEPETYTKEQVGRLRGQFLEQAALIRQVYDDRISQLEAHLQMYVQSKKEPILTRHAEPVGGLSPMSHRSAGPAGPSSTEQKVAYEKAMKSAKERILKSLASS